MNEKKTIDEQLSEKTRRRLDSAASWTVAIGVILAVVLKILYHWLYWH